MNSYLNVWASAQNLCARFIADNPSMEFGEVIDFDNVDGNELPSGNLIGIYQLDYIEKGSLIYVQVVFPISFENDESSLKLNTAVGALGQYVRPQTTHQFYNYETSAIIGKMVPRDELAISPMIKTKGRQFKFVSQGFVFDQTSSLQP